MTFTSSGIDPGEDPTTDVQVDAVAGSEFQRVKLADPTEGSTDPVGTAANPHRVTLENTGANTVAVKTVDKRATSVTTEANKSVTNTNTPLADANTNRLDGWVKSKSSNTVNVFVSLSDTASTAKPTELEPGQTLRFGHAYTGAVAGITASGSATVEVVEI